MMTKKMQSSSVLEKIRKMDVSNVKHLHTINLLGYFFEYTRPSITKMILIIKVNKIADD